MNILTWLDDVLELAPIVEKLLRDGFTLGLLLSVAVFLVRRYRKKFPNQTDRLERKIDIIAERQGIEWAAYGLKPYSTDSATKNRLRFISHWVASIIARIVKGNMKFHITERRMNMAQKLKSRKFILAVVSAILIILNDGLELGIDSETVITFASLVAAWIIGESAVDAKRAGGKANDDTLNIPTDDRI